MYAWMDLVLVFILGFVLGGILSVLHFRSQLKVYKRFIESRLDSVNLPLVSRVFRSRSLASARKHDSDQSASQRTK